MPHDFTEYVFHKEPFAVAMTRILRRLRIAAARGPTAMVRVADGNDMIELQLLHALGAPLSQSAGGAKAIRAVWIRPVAMVGSALPELTEKLAKPPKPSEVFDVVLSPNEPGRLVILDISNDGPLASAIPHPPTSP